MVLPAGIYGLSNHLLDTPWPKVKRGKAGLIRVLDPAIDSSAIGSEELLQVLADRTPAAVENLPETGVGEARERTLSPPFIVSPAYGTRSSSLFLAEKAGDSLFVEQIYRPSGERLEQRRFRIDQHGSIDQSDPIEGSSEGGQRDAGARV
jgi:uncharacterized protein with NRDE domain